MFIAGNNKSGKQTLPIDFLNVIHQQAVFESSSLASFVTQVKRMNVHKNLNAWVPGQYAFYIDTYMF